MTQMLPTTPHPYRYYLIHFFQQFTILVIGLLLLFAGSPAQAEIFDDLQVGSLLEIVPVEDNQLLLLDDDVCRLIDFHGNVINTWQMAHPEMPTDDAQEIVYAGAIHGQWVFCVFSYDKNQSYCAYASSSGEMSYSAYFNAQVNGCISDEDGLILLGSTFTDISEESACMHAWIGKVDLDGNLLWENTCDAITRKNCGADVAFIHGFLTDATIWAVERHRTSDGAVMKLVPYTLNGVMGTPVIIDLKEAFPEYHITNFEFGVQDLQYRPDSLVHLTVGLQLAQERAMLLPAYLVFDTRGKIQTATDYPNYRSIYGMTWVDDQGYALGLSEEYEYDIQSLENAASQVLLTGVHETMAIYPTETNALQLLVNDSGQLVVAGTLFYGWIDPDPNAPPVQVLFMDEVQIK